MKIWPRIVELCEPLLELGRYGDGQVRLGGSTSTPFVSYVAKKLTGDSLRWHSNTNPCANETNLDDTNVRKRYTESSTRGTPALSHRTRCLKD